MDRSYSLALATLLILAALFKNSFSVGIIFSSRCTDQSCSLLTTFRPVAPSSKNLTLVFSPGTHRMSSTTMILQSHEFIELKPSSTNNQTVILCRPTSQRYGSSFYNMVISNTAHVKISGLIFSKCNVQLSKVNKTEILKTEFVNGTKGAIQFSNSYNITIDKSTFKNNIDSSNYYKSVLFSSSAGVLITETDFTNNRLGSQSRVIELASCRNITIDKSTFTKNIGSYNSGILVITSTGAVKITRTNFTSNNLSSHSGVILSSNSFVFIGCSNFYSNTAGSHGGVINHGYGSGSLLSISSTIFGNNTVNTNGGIVLLASSEDELLIINSTFVNNQIGGYGGAISLNNNKQTSATIIATKFIGLGSSVYSRSIDVIIDCSVFVNSTIPTRYIRNDIGFCAKYGSLKSTECTNTECNLMDCRPLTTEISLEQSEYIVDEGIGKLNRALQVCVEAIDLLFGVKLTLDVYNGSALENVDYIIDKPDCRGFQFVRKSGTQKQCKYIRILEDSVKEDTEQFSVGLATTNPYVRFKIKRATVFIMEGVETTTRFTENTPTPTSKSMTPTSIKPTTAIPTDRPTTTNKHTTAIPTHKPTTEYYTTTSSTPTDEPTTSAIDKLTTSRPTELTEKTTFAPTDRPRTPIRAGTGPSKTAIVECGPLRRYVNFTSECTDHRNLISAIAQSFGGITRLKTHNIAVLQVKSKQQKYYFDVLSPVAAIDDYSMVKVVPYDGFSCTPKSTL